MLETDLSAILSMEGVVFSSSFSMDVGIGVHSLVLLLSWIIRGKIL